jgi:hypothetical protein
LDKYICHVCGYPNLDEQPLLESHNICPCCGVEYGYEDCKFVSYKKFKNDWIASGAKWFDQELKPSDWDLEKQLENINKIPQALLPYYLRS